MISNPTFELPVNYQAEILPGELGIDPAGVQTILAQFESQVQRGLHPGAQLVILRHGHVLLDRSIGYTHTSRKHAVLPTTPFLVYSISKPFTAMCIHHLVDRRLIDLDAPIATYWPEFGCRGKETATVRHALLHQAGIPIRGLYSQVFRWPSWSAVTRSIAALPAEFTPGTRTAYHLVNFGFILGEVVRRVSGLPIQDYLQQHLAGPLGLQNTRLGLAPELRGREAGIYWGHSSQRKAALVFRLPLFRQAVIPAASLHSTAREIAIFFQMLLNAGLYAGRRFFSPEIVQAATRVSYTGYDELIRVNIRWGMGFSMGGDWEPGVQGGNIFGHRSTPRTFGHGGQATSIAWADPDEQLVFVFLCNCLQDDEIVLERYNSLANALWDSIQ